MEIQVNTGDQNSQPIGQNEIGQPTQNLKKTRLTYLVVAASVLVSFTILGLVGYYLLGKQFSQYKTDKGKDQANPTPATTRTDLASNGEITYIGPDSLITVTGFSKPKFNSKNASYLLVEGPSTSYSVSFYKNREAFTARWPDESKNSDGNNAGTGSALSDETVVIKGLTYRKRYSYYNPLKVTKSGAFDPEISSIWSTSCVHFLSDGGVLIFYADPAGDGSDACNLLQGKDISVDVRELSERKSADVLVQSGSYYGPPFDPNLYQLELEPSQHLFAKSDSVDLKKYLGKNIKVRYREVKGVVMGEQQLVVVDSVE